MIKVRVERAWDMNGYNVWILEYDTFRKTGSVAKPIDLIQGSKYGNSNY